MSDVVLAEKVCIKCGESKPLSQFYRSKAYSDGHIATCKICEQPRVQAARAKRKARLGEEEFRAQNTASVQRHRAAGKDDGRDRRAYRNAVHELRRRHPEEFIVILRQERYDLGLDPDGHRQGAA